MTLITRARDATARGSLQAASNRYGDLLARDDELETCSLDFRLKARRESGDVFARLAAREQDRRRANSLRREASEQYEAYLSTYLASPADSDPLFATVVLNAFANMTFETDECDRLCDRLAAMAESRPSLFDLGSIDKWRKCLETSTWDAGTRAARRSEYCGLFSRPELHLSGGATAAFAAPCSAP